MLWKKADHRWLYWVFVVGAGIVVFMQKVPVPDKIAYWLCTGVFVLFTYGKLSWLANPVFIWLGAISYTLYLVHQNIGYLILNQLKGLGSPVAIILTTILVLILSHLVNTFLEKPFSRWFKAKLLVV